MPITKKASEIVNNACAVATVANAKKAAAKKKATAKAVAPAVANAPAAPALPKATSPFEAHALQTLADFFQSADYQKDSPVLHVYSQEKAVFIRNFLKVANLRAKEKGKKFKFVTVKS